MKLQTVLIATHIIAFGTGYYLSFKNCRSESSWLRHGIKDKEA